MVGGAFTKMGGPCERVGVGRKCRALSLLDASHPKRRGLIGSSEERSVWAKTRLQKHMEIDMCVRHAHVFFSVGASDTLGRGLASQTSLRSWPRWIPVVTGNRWLDALSENAHNAHGVDSASRRDSGRGHPIL